MSLFLQIMAWWIPACCIMFAAIYYADHLTSQRIGYNPEQEWWDAFDVRLKPDVCKEMETWGTISHNHVFGAKVCLDRLEHKFDKAHHATPCIVYSFGIDNTQSLEQFAAHHRGCRIWTFDARTHTQTGPSTKYEHVFFQRGLIGSEDKYVPNWDAEQRTLTSWMKYFGHDHVDVIRMRTEKAEEFGVMRELMSPTRDPILNNIGQLAIRVKFLHQASLEEQHREEETMKKFMHDSHYNLFARKFEIGGMHHSLTLPNGHVIGCCAELSFINPTLHLHEHMADHDEHPRAGKAKKLPKPRSEWHGIHRVQHD